MGFAFVLGGCATNSDSMRSFTIAGGQTVTLLVSPSGAVRTENADVKIEITGFTLDGVPKEVVYTFGLTEKNRAVPRSVKVEDVTGSTAEILVEDKSPQLESGEYWQGSATPRKRGDVGLAWLNERGDTIKIFRFTIVTADGRELVMHQASVWSGSSKPRVRQLLDEQG